jgi:hypothetical protein
MRACTTSLGLALLAASTAALPGSVSRRDARLASARASSDNVDRPYVSYLASAGLPTTAGGASQAYRVWHKSKKWADPKKVSGLTFQSAGDAIGFRVHDAPNTAVLITVGACLEREGAPADGCAGNGGIGAALIHDHVRYQRQ